MSDYPHPLAGSSLEGTIAKVRRLAEAFPDLCRGLDPRDLRRLEECWLGAAAELYAATRPRSVASAIMKRDLDAWRRGGGF